MQLAAYSAAVFTVGTATANPTVTSPAFSPAAGDVIYACGFVDDSSAALTENTPTSTGTLTWTLVARDNIFSGSVLAGVASVWRAVSASAQAGITVTYSATSALTTSHAGIAILGFTGADLVQAGAASGVRNSVASTTALGAAAMTTTRPGSWCWMAGQSYTSLTTITPPGGQATQCPAQNPGSGDTVWSQAESPQPAASRAQGTSVTMSATAGAAQTAHLVWFEVLPAAGDPGPRRKRWPLGRTPRMAGGRVRRPAPYTPDLPGGWGIPL